jgi:hypothetical protein
VNDDIADESDDLDVMAIHYKDAKAVLTCGCHVPVTHWFDWQGFDCEAKDALTCVCGDEEHGWFVLDLGNFDHATVH